MSQPISNPNVVYHSVDPQANKTTFTDFDTAEFIINTDRNIVRNSIRIEGELEVQKSNYPGGARNDFDSRLHFSKRVGAHALLESITTQIGSDTIESIHDGYGRLVNMTMSAEKAVDDYYSSDHLCELKAPSTQAAIAFCCGKGLTTNAGQTFTNNDFSFKPYIAVNRCDNDIPLGRLGGQMTISINFGRQEDVLAGIGQVATSGYSVTNLRLTYRTVAPASVPQVNMNSVVVVKQVALSNNASISTKVPAVCQAVSVSFLKSGRENARNFDTKALEKPPQLDEVQHLFNDSTSRLQQYVQKDYGEYMDGYLSSLKTAGHHAANPNTVRANQVFGVGLNFGMDVDLSNSKYGLELKSQISNTDQYLVFMYFHSKKSL